MERVYLRGIILCVLAVFAGCTKDPSEQLRRLRVDPPTVQVGSSTTVKVVDSEKKELPKCLAEPGHIWLRVGGAVHQLALPAPGVFADQGKTFMFTFYAEQRFRGNGEFFWCHAKQPDPKAAGHTQISIIPPSVTASPAPGVTSAPVVLDALVQADITEKVAVEANRIEKSLEAKVREIAAANAKNSGVLQGHESQMGDLRRDVAGMRDELAKLDKAGKLASKDLWDELVRVSRRVDSVEASTNSQITLTQKEIDRHRAAMEAKTGSLDRTVREVAAGAAEGLQGRINFGKTTVRRFLPFVKKQQRETDEVIRSLEETKQRMLAIARGEDIPIPSARMQQ